MIPFAIVAQRAYEPFLIPLPIWDYWYLLLFPRCAAVAIVYKSLKCWQMSQVPKEAAVLTAWIVLGMAGAAVVLTLSVHWLG